MEHRSYALGAGLFVLLLLALLVAAILQFNERGHMRGVPYDLISSSSVAGLTIGSPARLRGVEVGQVQSIDFEADDPARIRVRIVIDPKFHLWKGSYATLNYQGLSGNAYVELDFSDGAREPLMSTPRAPAQIPLRRSAWAELPETGEAFLTTFTGTLERVNSVLSPENRQQLSRMLLQFGAAAGEITAIARDLRPAMQRVDTVVTDTDETLRSAHRTLEDLGTFVNDARTHVAALDQVGEGAHQAGLAARGVEHALVLETLPRFDQLLQGLSQNSDMLQELLVQLKERPQSVIFGAQPPPSGPGEPGFSPRRDR